MAYPCAVLLRFAPTPESPASNAGSDPSRHRTLLFVAAAVSIAATMLPWVRVQFEGLFGRHAGPPGWQSSAGFTCLCTCLLVAMLAMSETNAKATQQAARPGSLLLVLLATLALAFEWWQGPGHLGGVSACWTVAFWVGLATCPLLLFACARRFASIQTR